MPFTLPAPTTNVNGWAPIWANFTAIAAFLNALNVSAIKTIQAGIITIGAGVSSNTFTLPTSVTVAKAFVVFDGWTATADTRPATDSPYVQLTNANTVTATRNSAGADTTTVTFTVVEFN